MFCYFSFISCHSFYPHFVCTISLRVCSVTVLSNVSKGLLEFLLASEFWKQVPPSEPYRVILSDVRDKLYQTRERSRHLLSSGMSDIPDNASYTNLE